jgi:murein DD-endopeptidase MepM/ murein hydrolase activator NlpD
MSSVVPAVSTWRRFILIGATIGMAGSLVAISHAQTPEGAKKGKKGKAEQSQPLAPGEDGDTNSLQPPNLEMPDGRVGRGAITQEVFRGIYGRGDKRANADRGMIQTGLVAKFDERIYCRVIDDYWAQDYGTSLHGGIDIPVPFNTPLHSIAAGELINKSLRTDAPDGIQIWLRHSPDDTGLPMWTFSQYTHLRELPDLPLGQHVGMGDVIGITGNSGASRGAKRASARRPALHLGVIYNESGKYFSNGEYIIPLDGRWMDPHAIYRKVGPYDSVALKALPADEKAISIPYMLPDGKTVPADTKLIWPYPCSTTPLPSVQVK